MNTPVAGRFESVEAFARYIFDKQDNHIEIMPSEHRVLITLVDSFEIGMDGFKYCSRATAVANYQRFHR